MSNLDCGICREQEKSDFETRCGHHFHKKCLELWIRRQRVCPCCRTSITGNKKLEHAIRYCDGNEEMLKGLRKSELLEILRHFCVAKTGHFESIIVALRRKGWNINGPLTDNIFKCKNFEPLISLACIEGNLPMVSHLIKLGVDINKPIGFKRRYPIDYAIEKGNVDLLNLLIERGVDLTISGSHGLSPIFYACKCAKIEIVERLLQHVSDINELDVNGLSLLHTVAYAFDKNLDRVHVARLLISNGANVNALSKSQWTALHFAVNQGHVALVHLLLEHGADVNLTCGDKTNTILLIASKCSSFEIVKKLVDHGADLNARDSKGLNPLHLACENGDIEMVKFFIEKGISIDSRSETGATPLQLALLDSHYELALLLLDSGSQATLLTSTGLSALHALCNSAKSEKTDLQMKILTRLLKAGCCPKAANQATLETPLLLLSYNDPSMTLVSTLVKHGADLNAKNRQGLTALHRAVLFGNPTLVKKLISLGADVTAIDKKGRHPIHYVLKGFRKPRGTLSLDGSKFFKIIEALKSAGADLNAKTHRGATAFHYVKGDEEINILRRFEMHGADIFAKDKKGRDLKFRARKRKLYGILDWIDGNEMIMNMEDTFANFKRKFSTGYFR